MFKQCHHLLQFSKIRHGFFSASAPGWPSLSPTFSAHEDKNEVLERRRFLVKTLLGYDAPLFTLKQTHSNEVIHVKEPWDVFNPPLADGMVTTERGFVLGIYTADCGPVLFYDYKNNIIGACHAGWKGAENGILQKTLQEMLRLGGERTSIKATLGPTIFQESYEVGPEFPDLILQKDMQYKNFFYPSLKPQHHYFDLPQYIKYQLNEEGIDHFHMMNINTFSQNYNSRRHQIALNQQYIGTSNLSAIAIL